MYTYIYKHIDTCLKMRKLNLLEIHFPTEAHKDSLFSLLFTVLAFKFRFDPF